MMTTGLQLALLAGSLIALGLTLAALQFVPSYPDPQDVLRRYADTTVPAKSSGPPAASNQTDLLGLWGIAHLPAGWWGKTPYKALALMQVPLHRHYGKKLLYGTVGLLLPPLLGYFLTVLGWPIPVLIPAAGSLALAVILFFSPDIDVAAAAKAARLEFNRALGAYIDLVALERLAGSGSRQSMEYAAEIGNSWVFRRLSEELSRSRWSGVPPWDALHTLADELGLPELDDLADIMRLSKEGTQVYNNLRARSSAMRSAMLNDQRAKANATVERMSMPMSMLGIVFMVILITPSLLRVMTGG